MMTQQRAYLRVGGAIVLGYLLATMLVAPAHQRPQALVLAVAYLVLTWLSLGNYLGNVIHLGIAHQSLSYPRWFIYLVSFVNNVLFVYVDPRGWVERHRNHHADSDTNDDPNKHPGDGFLATLRNTFRPYPCRRHLARDDIFRRGPLNLLSSWPAAVVCQITSFLAVAALTRHAGLAVTFWIGSRLLALYGNMLLIYYVHDRRFGSSTYDTGDDSRNLDDPLTVMLTFSHSLHNNHHRATNLCRMSHDDRQFDFGFWTIRMMYRLGLVTPTTSGARVPPGIGLKELGLDRSPEVVGQRAFP